MRILSFFLAFTVVGGTCGIFSSIIATPIVYFMFHEYGTGPIFGCGLGSALGGGMSAGLIISTIGYSKFRRWIYGV